MCFILNLCTYLRSMRSIAVSMMSSEIADQEMSLISDSLTDKFDWYRERISGSLTEQKFIGCLQAPRLTL